MTTLPPGTTNLPDDPLYQEAKALAAASGYASVSMVHSRLRIGYLRAAHLVKRMANDSFITKEPDDAGRWQVLNV